MSHDQVAQPGQQMARAAYKAAQNARTSSAVINIGHHIGEAAGDDDSDESLRSCTPWVRDVKHHGL
jgi:hypothetical protein